MKFKDKKLKIIHHIFNQWRRLEPWAKVFLIGAVAAVAVYYFGIAKKADTESKAWKNWKKVGAAYEVLVETRDEVNPDPVQDKKYSLKAGDVVAVVPGGHRWSETELTSYLLLKLNINEKDAQNLVQPEEKDIVTEDGEKDTETIKARAYRLKIETLQFSPDEIQKGQPFRNQVFGAELIEKKQ